MLHKTWSPETEQRIKVNLRIIRIMTGHSTYTLAKAMEISPGTISTHETRGSATIESLKKYAQYYHIPVEDFYTMNPEEFSKKWADGCLEKTKLYPRKYAKSQYPRTVITRKRICENLGVIRLANGYSRRGLSEKIGMKEVTVTEHERGRFFVKDTFLKRYADFYRIPVEDFYELDQKEFYARYGEKVTSHKNLTP